MQAFSYFSYVRAFVPEPGQEGPVLHGEWVAIALAVAPLAFVAVGLISRSRELLRKVLVSTGVLTAIGLSLGLLNPLIGAAAGFGTGFSLTLNKPDFDGQMRRRLVAVFLAVAYMFVLLVSISSAAVLAGAIVPGLSVGFADEYGAWRAARSGE